jgi:hypothetical protein
VRSISNFRALAGPKFAVCYTARMVKKITLKEIGEMLAHVVKHMATKEDLVDLRRELKADIFNVQKQVNSIESQIRGMNHVRLEGRVADLEEKVFGKAR